MHKLPSLARFVHRYRYLKTSNLILIPLLLRLEMSWLKLDYSVPSTTLPLLLRVEMSWLKLDYSAPSTTLPLLLRLEMSWLKLDYSAPCTSLPLLLRLEMSWLKLDWFCSKYCFCFSSMILASVFLGNRRSVSESLSLTILLVRGGPHSVN